MATRLGSRGMLREDPYSAGMPEQGVLPDVETVIGGTQATLDRLIGSLPVTVPVLGDRDRQFRVGLASVGREHILLEFGPAVNQMRFVRTGQVLDCPWWLWSFQCPTHGLCFVAVGVVGGTATAWACCVNATWTADQILFYAFLRVTHARGLHVQRYRDWGWKLVPTGTGASIAAARG